MLCTTLTALPSFNTDRVLKEKKKKSEGEEKEGEEEEEEEEKGKGKQRFWTFVQFQIWKFLLPPLFLWHTWDVDTYESFSALKMHQKQPLFKMEYEENIN